jgi:hypothetical protein
MIWREIREHSINACGQTSEAAAEFFAHAHSAIRELYAGIDVAELEADGKKLPVKAGDDRVAFPTDIYAIADCFNLTTGERVEPEEEGRRGRSKFLEETTGQPPSGTVYRYVRSGNHLLLRDTADVATLLSISYKLHPPPITDSDLDASPLAPPQYDWPTIWLITSNYYGVHPVFDKEGMDQQLDRKYEQKAWGKVQKQQMKDPKAYEERDKRTRLVSWGYSTGGRF